MILANTDYSSQQLVTNVQSMIGRRIAGLAAIACELDTELIDELDKLSMDPGLTAILCVNDLMAIGAMREIRERGLRVPEDISVTGFHDVALAHYWYPALTSVHIPRDKIGQMVSDALVSDEKSRPGHEMVIEPELVLRNSTALR